MENDDEKMKFAKKLNNLLYEKQMLAKDLSQRTGISEASLSKYRHGDYIPQGQNLISIAKALGTSVEFLLGKDISKEEAETNKVMRTPTPRAADKQSELYKNGNIHTKSYVSSSTYTYDSKITEETINASAELNILTKLPLLSDDAKRLISDTVDALLDGKQDNPQLIAAYFNALNRVRS